jgi:serine/threonine protein kinase
MQFPEGTRLGPYEIVAPIGAGGMGEVYRAKDTRLDRVVAIKVLSEARVQSSEMRERFEREARAISGLNHPHICTLHDIGHQDGIEFLVMEYIAGETLADRLRKGPLPLAQVLQYSIQIAQALAAAHGHGVIHRDLKPGNIVLTKGGAKLLDFGLAKMRASEHALAATAGVTETVPLTGEGRIVGTPQYLAPEQLDGKEADNRTDIFALGAVIYEMATGRRAFTGDSQASLIVSIMTVSPPPISTVQRIAPPALDHLVMACLEKDPEARWQSAGDLATELQWLAENPKAHSEPARASRRWPWIASAFITTAVLVGSAYWIGTRAATAPSTTPGVFRRLTNDPGLTTDGVLSPDGKLLAYASDRADSSNLDIWVQQVDGSGVMRITDDPADDSDPAFSPDGTQVVFRSERSGGGIYAASVLGGEARLLVPQGRRPRFSPDGTRLMYWTGPIPGDVRGSADVKLWVRSQSGGAPVQIAAGCRLFEKTPVWSPDGSRILFLGSCEKYVPGKNDRPEDYRISAWVATSDGKQLYRNSGLYSFWHSVHGKPAISDWIDNPSRLLIPLPLGDAISVATLPISPDGQRMTGAPVTLTFAGGQAARVSADRSGRVAISAGTSESHIWRMPIDSRGTVTGPATQVTFGPAGENKPRLSDDGTKLVFLSQRVNGQRLFYKDLVSGHEKELSTVGYRYDTPIWNRAGTKIMCVQYPKPESWRDVIFEVPVSGGISRIVWEEWSWLTDWSADESILFTNAGQLHLPTMSLTEFLVPAKGEDASEARLSHDQRWVAFGVSPHKEYVGGNDKAAIFVAPFRRGSVPRSEWVQATRGDDHNFEPQFSHDDRLIIFASQREGYRCLWGQRLTADARPQGEAFAIYHNHERRRPLVGYRDFEIGPHEMVIARAEVTGNIWLLQPATGKDEKVR